MNLVFIDPTPLVYTAETPEVQPLGGTQSAICYLSTELARVGHRIVVLNGNPTTGESRGVRFEPFVGLDGQRAKNYRADYIIVSLPTRSIECRRWFGGEPQLIHWVQYAHDQPVAQELRTPTARDLHDRFAFVSEWQMRGFQTAFGVSAERSVVLRNAVAPVFERMFAADESILRQRDRPPTLVYTSTPFRGLSALVEMFPLIRRELPDVRLRVYSSMRVYQSASAFEQTHFGGLYERCRATDGVELMGSVSQRELATAMRSASLLAYPNTFAETSCISVMEALAAGCEVVTSERGALPETLGGFGRAISLDRGCAHYVREFVRTVVEHLRESMLAPPAVEQRLRRQIEALGLHGTWHARAAEWSAWLEANR